MTGEIEIQDTVKIKSRLSKVANWGLPSIDFSKPGQSKTLLKTINILCKVLGKRLPIRFFAHYENGFDALVLQHLPDVQWLLIDSLQEISNPEYIFELTKLKKFSFGVYNYDNPDFLHKLKLDDLEQLTLGETKKRNFDLSPLRLGKQMQSLSVEGHHKNIDVIGDLENLETLRLFSIGKTASLKFVSSIATLETLEIGLGGRENIDEISAPSLKNLKIVRVQGFNDIGDLSRFPQLRRLHVEGQIKLLSMSLQTPDLTQLRIISCKSLKVLTGLEGLQKINYVHCAVTSLNYDALIEVNWAKSLKVLSLYSGNPKRDAALEQKIEAKGYRYYL